MIVCGTEITPFVKGFFENATSLFSKQLVQAMLLRKLISIPAKFSNLNLPPILIRVFLKKLNKSNHNTRNQNTRDFIKSVNFVIVYIPKANVLLMEKFVIFALKRTISKFAAHVLVKKYMKLKKTNLMNPPTRAIISFLLKLLIFRILHTLTKSGMKTLVNNPTLEGDFCFIQNWYRSSM